MNRSGTTDTHSGSRDPRRCAVTDGFSHFFSSSLNFNNAVSRRGFTFPPRDKCPFVY
jgi:hypothetical protein